LSRGYQLSDAHIVDYQVYQLPGVRGAFRGPPLTSDRYIACIGAAQTFGRFVQTPFPSLVAEALGVEALNLGQGGVGPSFALGVPGLMDYINRAEAVIVQVVSGRSQSNSMFRIVNHSNRGMNLVEGREQRAEEFYTWLIGQGVDVARKIVAETRENYVDEMTRLLHAIEPPKILLWFSVRSPDYEDRWELPLWRMWREFPHLVNREMVNRLRAHSNRYVECISRRGLPQPLFDRSGQPTSFQSYSLPGGPQIRKTENNYYPSPEMHEDAAALLMPACRELR
jgi:hypothetical protein